MGEMAIFTKIPILSEATLFFHCIMLSVVTYTTLTVVMYTTVSKSLPVGVSMMDVPPLGVCKKTNIECQHLTILGQIPYVITEKAGASAKLSLNPI